MIYNPVRITILIKNFKRIYRHGNDHELKYIKLAKIICNGEKDEFTYRI